MTGTHAGRLPISADAIIEQERNSMPLLDPAHFLPSFVWRAAPDGRIRFVNPWTCSYLGMSADALLDKHWKAFVEPSDQILVIDAWQAMVAGSPLQEVDVRLRRADGAYRWHTLHLQTVLDERGQIAEAVGVAIDIHHARHAWQMYKASERRLQAAFEAARLGAWEWDMETGVVRLTAQLAQIYDFPPHTEAVTPAELWQRVPLDYQPRFQAELTEVLNDCLPFQLDYPIDISGRARRWLRMRGETEFDERGTLKRAHGVTFDISAQRASDQMLSLSERRYRALVEATTALVWSADPQGEILAPSSQWERFTGRPSESHAGSGWLAAVHPDDREEVRRRWLSSVRMQTLHDFTFRMRRHDGVYRMVRAHAAPLYDENRTLQEWFGTTTDVTDQHEANAAIEERNLRLSVAMHAANMTIVSLDLASWSFSWEIGLAAIHGGQPHAIGYKTALGYVRAEDRDRLDTLLKQLANGEDSEAHLEFRIQYQGGERWMQGSALLQRGERGQPLRIIGSLVDITERKRMELVLRETDRRKDEFLAMLAHELRNPLAPLRTAIALLQKMGLDGPRVADLIDLMQRQVEHMTRIVDDLLEVSRITQGRITLKQEPIFIGSAIYGAVEAISAMVESRAQRLSVDVPPSATWVSGDATRLSQILVNILNNASKYTPEGGHISIGVTADEDRVTIVIEDTGTGISADLLPNVFELFSQGERTLDRSHGGLGIGLSLVKKLVEMHEGTIVVQSPGPGMGTSVTVRLPRLHQQERQVQHQHQPVAAESGEEQAALRILVVDDNRDAADSLAMLCETDSHATRVAYASPEAVTLAQSFSPDVALLDIGLPDIDGYELAGLLRPKGSKTPVLIAITGYGQAEDRLRAQAAGFDYHFVKPVDVEKLLALLSELPQAD
jgi:PAS domain S-box-containing protein